MNDAVYTSGLATWRINNILPDDSQVIAMCGVVLAAARARIMDLNNI